MHVLDLDRWERREHFRFFRGYDNPFFNLCANVDVATLSERCNDPDGLSFFAASLYLSLRSANEIEPFRYRIQGDQVIVHDTLHGGCTILREDETFGFGYFDFDADFSCFAAGVEREVERVQGERGPLEDRPERDDLVHYSVIPWVAFTSFSHARRWGTSDSVPKIVFGRRHEEGGHERMPVSVEVHHALVDGLHVGRFFDRFQRYLNDLRSGGLEV